MNPVSLASSSKPQEGADRCFRGLQEQLEDKMRKGKTSLLIALGVTVLVGSGVLWLAKNRSTVQAQEMATTPKQKEHGKLYKGYGGGINLRELAAKQGGDVAVVETPPIPFDFDARPPFLKAIACDADAIVVGVIKDKSYSQLTEDESFIFTDYEMVVQEIIKDNPAAPLQSNDIITVSRPGGEIKLNGKFVRAIDESFKPFQMNQQYVLFLRFIPSTDGYRAFSNGSFQLQKEKVVRLGEGTLWGRLESEKSAFMTAIHDAMTSACPPVMKALM